MRKMDLQRTITEGTASRALRDMERDTHRTARNLVDLCLRFAKGPFERRFFTVCRDILEDDGSPCFSMLRRALSCFDRQTLVTFGVNVGFEGCSRGAKRIRETEAREGFNVPWAIRVAVGDAGLSRVYTQRLISEAVELGVHVFILEDHGLALSDLRHLPHYPGPELGTGRLDGLPQFLDVCGWRGAPCHGAVRSPGGCPDALRRVAAV